MALALTASLRSALCTDHIMPQTGDPTVSQQKPASTPLARRDPNAGFSPASGKENKPASTNSAGAHNPEVKAPSGTEKGNLRAHGAIIKISGADDQSDGFTSPVLAAKTNPIPSALAEDNKETTTAAAATCTVATKGEAADPDHGVDMITCEVAGPVGANNTAFPPEFGSGVDNKVSCAGKSLFWLVFGGAAWVKPLVCPMSDTKSSNINQHRTTAGCPPGKTFKFARALGEAATQGVRGLQVVVDEDGRNVATVCLLTVAWAALKGTEVRLHPST